MPKNYSANFKDNLHRVSAPETPLLLLEITHADLAVPVRVVNDNSDLISNGNTFIALAFRATLPDDLASGLPHAKLSIDNVGKDLTSWIESSVGGKDAQVRMMQVLRSDPDVIEWDITLDLNNVSINVNEVSGTLGYEDLLNQPAVPLTYRPDTTSGLF